MSIASETSVVSASYARRAPGGGFTARRAVIVLLGVVAVAITVGSVTNSFGWLDRWLPIKASGYQMHEVHPLTLAITLNEDGELKPKEQIEVKSEIEGQATIIWLIPESSKVKKGDKLVELASDELQLRAEGEDVELQKIRTELDSATQELNITLSENASKVKKAEIELDVARLELTRYMEGEYEKSLKSANIDIMQTEIDIAQKEEEVRKNRDLFKKNFVTKTKLKELEDSLAKSRMTLEKNKLEKHILTEYEKPKNEMQKKSAVDQAEKELEREIDRAKSREAQQTAKVEEQKVLLGMKETRLKKLREQLSKCTMLAPIDGVVQYAGDTGRMRWGGSRIAPGEKVYEGQAIVSLPDVSQMIVSTRVHEADRHQVKEGMACFVKVPAVPGKRFKGTIAKISTFADSADRWLNPQLKEHSAEILLDETDAPVSPGDSAEIEVQIAEIPDVLAVPVQSVYSRGEKRFVFAQKGGSVQPIEVKIGRANTTLVEVREGLQAGDRVVMGATPDLLSKLPDVAPAREMPPVPPGGPGMGGKEQRSAGAPGAGGPGGGGRRGGGEGKMKPGAGQPGQVKVVQPATETKTDAKPEVKTETKSETKSEK